MQARRFESAKECWDKRDAISPSAVGDSKKGNLFRRQSKVAF